MKEFYIIVYKSQIDLAKFYFNIIFFLNINNNFIKIMKIFEIINIKNIIIKIILLKYEKNKTLFWLMS